MQFNTPVTLPTLLDADYSSKKVKWLRAITNYGQVWFRASSLITDRI